MSSEPWGRVDEQGNVYVRTAGGERIVGSWAAGSPDEALAFFQRKYEGLVLEVDLLERRIRETDLSPKEALHSIERLKETVATANAVGDLDGLVRRLDALVEIVQQRREEIKAAKSRALQEAREAKERIVAEAESIAAGNNWRGGGERLRQLVEEWKSVPRLDRKTDDELWSRFSQARSHFTKRRKQHFQQLDAQREEARLRKEKLVAEAEALADSTDWGPTSARFRELMREWKAAGRAHRDVEDELWERFRKAQDTFFQARAQVFAERDAELRENQEAKEALVAEAEKLLPVTDYRAARAVLRSIHERWEAIGPVPRDARARLEGRLSAVERAVREAEEEEWRRTNPEARARAEATVAQLRNSIAQLERAAEQARQSGDQRKLAETEEALQARRALLEAAEKTLAEFSGA
ncbi:DUF349 domain-containing protein [Carbonactinospora thermoautotrophica]|uniref:DUF349 domain-containing protein n=1 Tax=Carbonactinospora thermoautotrophica TaxID=1469144 RepID=A0A132NAG3_9ACTN|nr:DUF349 domain-containing protein [Carbonactinospora thermoautotrophica]KWX00665.1 hypothetical protein LI90_1688 [Carbonactinospora thermoautotrophica]KWX05337.1 hypothetical protein TH66_03720 [Carbonactinospora thermoautotrophica]KWX07074.1 hypothetical protein TR74_19995 [Carbonactinospora thermoautotrophica]MCX9193050.1 DUF349 domain-containing protein [Carbonactinospora thermoautotrophica]